MTPLIDVRAKLREEFKHVPLFDKLFDEACQKLATIDEEHIRKFIKDKVNESADKPGKTIIGKLWRKVYRFFTPKK